MADRMFATAYIAVCLVLLGGAAAVDLEERCSQITGAKKGEMTVLFGADPGEFSSTPEVLYYLDNLQNKTEFPSGLSVCPGISLGTIMGSKVAVITTGINAVNSASCILDFLQQCGPFVKDILYSGTSGWSVAKGGIINNGTGGCSVGKANSMLDITRIGDLCVSPYAVNWECKKATWTQQCGGYPDLCSYPDSVFDPSADFLFGQCQFTNVSKEQLALSDELMQAVKSGPSTLFPRRGQVVQSDEQTFWSLMRQNGNSYNYSFTAAPKVWGYKECMEIDGQFFYAGVPWEMVARKYVADTLNLAKITPTLGQADVVAVSAMEAVGVAQAIERYAALNSGRRIPYTNVRGMSNHLHQPIRYNATTSNWVYSGEVPENIAEGYRYAISTASSAVLRLLQARCDKAGLPRSTCSFKVNY